MSSGGKRPGAGRKPGSKASSVVVKPSARRDLAEALMERLKSIDITPLEIMMMDAKLNFDETQKMLQEAEALEEGEPKAELMQRARLSSGMAAESAAKVAPYIHAKLQTTTLKGDKENPLEVALGLTSADELRRAIRGNK